MAVFRMACKNCIAYIVSIYAFFLVAVVGVLLGFKIDLFKRNAGAGGAEGDAGGAGGVGGWLSDVLDTLLDYCWLPIGQILSSFFFGFYKRLTWTNLLLFSLKYLPTGLYVYKTLKGVYATSRERILKKQMELDDILLQIQIVDTKLCVRDAEFSERTEQLRRDAERLRAMRARVRQMIATDDGLRCALQRAADCSPIDDCDQDNNATQFTVEEESGFILALLKQLKGCEKCEKYGTLETDKMKHFDRHEQSEEHDQASDSVYSSLSDADSKQECHVKIIKVTKVYKLANLKHYIKQKRLKRATQQAILKKKIEDIRKLLESWQKSLNAVIYNKLSLEHVDVASREARGDYSKQNFREFSDSDSELKTSCTDMCFDEYNLNWTQSSYYNEEHSEPIESKQVFESSDYHHKYEMSYPLAHALHGPLCEASAGAGALFILPEETSSQVAIEEIDNDARDLVAI